MVDNELDALYKIYNINAAHEECGICKKELIKKKNLATDKIEYGLFKGKINCASKDNVIEAFVYELCQATCVKCCRSIVCMHSGEIGSFSRYQIPAGYKMYTFADISKKKLLSINEIYNIVRMRAPKDLSNLVNMMVIDYLVGQTDRHADNIALIKNYITSESKLYPLYDNGLALFGHVSKSNVAYFLKQGNFINRCGTKCEMLEFIVEHRKEITMGNITYKMIEECMNRADRYNEMGIERMRLSIEFIMDRFNEIKKAFVEGGMCNES